MNNNFISERWIKMEPLDNIYTHISFRLIPINFRNYQQSYFEIDKETEFSKISIEVNIYNEREKEIFIVSNKNNYSKTLENIKLNKITLFSDLFDYFKDEKLNEELLFIKINMIQNNMCSIYLNTLELIPSQEFREQFIKKNNLY